MKVARSVFFNLFSLSLILLSIFSCNQSRNEVILDLRDRHLTSIPESVFELQHLTYLDLGSSNVVFYPPLSALVDTTANALTELPDEIGKLTNLKTLILNSNQISRLPQSFTQLNQLEYLDLALNKNFRVAEEISKLKALPNLKVLALAGIEPLEKETIQLVKQELPNTTIITSPAEYMVRKRH